MNGDKGEDKVSLLRVLPRMFSRVWIPATLFVLLGASVCVRLGFWQLDRLEQRRAFNAQVASMRALDPLNLDSQIGRRR